MIKEPDVLLEVDSKGIALMTLNRPERLNALSSSMSEDLLPRLSRQVQEDDRIRVLVITGAGDGFCTGADVKDRLKRQIDGHLEFKRRVAEEQVGGFALYLASIRKPVIAAINGIAAGAGLSIALLSDIRIASSNARFITVFMRRGLMPDGGMTATLPLVVGLPKALELAMTSDPIDAQEALRIGLVNKVVPPKKLMPEARALAEKLATGPPLALSFVKRAMYRNVHMSIEEGLNYESWGQMVLRRTKDHKEGVESFLEKRLPVFRGE